VEREPDGLGGGRVQTQLRAERCDPRSNEIRKVREMGAYQIPGINSLLLVLGQQILIGRKCLDAPSEALDKIFRLMSRSLAGDHLHETEHVPGAMIDLTH
jgi:hypothetical protein